MDRDWDLKTAVWQYREGVETGLMAWRLADTLKGAGMPVEAIIDECRRQAGDLDPAQPEAQERERRLRKLVAIILDMKEVGLL